MKKNKAILILLISGVLLISGCFEFEDVITIRNDGSGTLAVHYSSYKESNMNWNGMKFPKEKESILEEIEKNYTSKKVRLSRFRVKEKDDYQHVYFTVKFDAVNDLNSIKQFTENRIAFDRISRSKIRFKREINIDKNKDKCDSDTSGLGGLILDLLEGSLFDKIKFRFELNLPGNIARTNANWEHADRQMVWKYTLSDFIEERVITMTAQTK